MKKKNLIFILIPIFLVFLLNFNCLCLAQKSTNNQVSLITDSGTIKITCFKETPLHTSNFLKLASEGFYDSTLFHRVIPGFMVQGGDPASKKAMPGQMLGSGDIGYKIPPEINPALFHKKGALAAARDNNPEKASNGSQFYIVFGSVYTDSMLTLLENNKNLVIKQQLFINFINKKENAVLKNTFIALQQNNRMDSLALLSQKIEPLILAEFEETPHFKFSKEQRLAYTTIGGAPHLDGDYTVFGQVMEGMEVIDKIMSTKRDQHDRPLNDIRMKIVVIKK